MTDAQLLQFATLAELGVTAEAFCFATGIKRKELDAECRKEWGCEAADAAERMFEHPVRLLLQLLAKATDEKLDNGITIPGDPKMLARLLDHREKVAGLERRKLDDIDKMTDEELRDFIRKEMERRPT